MHHDGGDSIFLKVLNNMGFYLQNFFLKVGMEEILKVKLVKEQE
jgi:hypothetical protein